jgi:uncharacterized membrane protein YgcG
MTTSLDTLVVPVRYYTALDPYNWKVDNRPMSDLDDNDDVLRSGVETALNAVKTGAAVDGRLLRALVGDNKASGNWTLHPSAVSITITDSIKVKTTTDDGFDVGVIAAQYAPVVFTLATPAAGFKNLVTISARYKLPNSADMPYYDQTQVLDALAVSLATAQTKQGTMEFAIATSTVAVGDPDNYFVHGSDYDALFHIKVLKTDTVLDPSRVLAVGITKLGQSVARATNATYGQVRFATGAEVTTGTSTDTVVSPADLKDSLPGAVAQATNATYGIVRFATGAEVTTGTSTDTVVSPADLKDRIDAIPTTPSVAQATNATYGIVRFATGTEVTAGTSTDTVVSPADLNTRALLGGDPLVNFQVEDAVDLKDAVNLGQMQNSISADWNFVNTEYYSTPGAHNWVIPPGVYRAIFDIQAGGGGGGQGGGSDGGSESGAGGSGGASGQFVRVLVYNLLPGQNVDIMVGHGGTRGGLVTGMTAGPGLASGVTINSNVIAAKGGNFGVRGGFGDDNGSAPPWRGAGGAEQPFYPVTAPFVIGSTPYQESGEGGGQSIYGGKGGDSATGTGGTGGTAGVGGLGVLGSGGGGGLGQPGAPSHGYAGGDGGDGYVKVYY